jgi:hypothetical protein
MKFHQKSFFLEIDYALMRECRWVKHIFIISFPPNLKITQVVTNFTIGHETLANSQIGDEHPSCKYYYF